MRDRRERHDSRKVSNEEYARTIAPKVALHYKEISRFGVAYANALLRRPSTEQRMRRSDLLPGSGAAQDLAAEAFVKLLSGERQDWDGNVETLQEAVKSCINSLVSGRLKRTENLDTTDLDDARIDWFYAAKRGADPYLEPLEEYADRHNKAKIVRRLLPAEEYGVEAELLQLLILDRVFNVDALAELTGMTNKRISEAFARLAGYVQTDEFFVRLSEVLAESTPTTVLSEVQQLAAGLEGGLVSSGRVARAIGLSTGQLADTVGLKRAALRAMRPPDAKTTGRLKEMLEIIARISAWAGGNNQAMLWYRGQPIPAFGGRTAESLVKSGQASALRDYLDHIAMGGFA